MTDRIAFFRWLRWGAGLALGWGALLGAHAATSGLIGRPAPDFGLHAAVGDNVRLSEYAGQPVVLVFWGSHCSACAAQLARLDRLYATYRAAGLVVLGVSVDDDPTRAAAYAHAHATTYPLLLDDSKAAGRDYAIDRLPSTVLIDRGGIVRFMHGDERVADGEYVREIRALLDDTVGGP